MDVRSLFFDLFSCVQLPCFIISQDGSGMDEEYLPHGFKYSEAARQEVLARARDFRRSVGDPQFCSAGEPYAALRLSDRRLLMILTRPARAAGADQAAAEEAAAAADTTSRQTVNLFLRLMRELCLRSELPNDDYQEEAARSGRFVPPEFEVAPKADKIHTHNQYRVEVFMLDAVTEGNEQKFNYAMSLPAGGTFGVLGPTRDRSLRNFVHLTNVLCSRAAIRGGVSPEEAYTLSDKIFMATELLPPAKINPELCRKAALAFLHQVRDYQERNKKLNLNGYVQEAQNYILRRLFDDISVQDAAAHCGISPGYLQKLFRQNTGLKISSFLQNERLKASCELLSESRLQVNEIASLLHFSSAPHFCRAFRQLFGQSPLIYRRQHLKKVSV